MPIPQTRGAKAAQAPERQVGDIDVQDQCPLERLTHQLRDQAPRNLRPRIEVPAALRRGAQRHRDGSQAEESPLDRGGHGARIQHVVAEVRTVVDAGDDHVVLEVEQPRDCQMNAVGWRAGHEVDIGLGGLEDAQRHIQRQ